MTAMDQTQRATPLPVPCGGCHTAPAAEMYLDDADWLALACPACAPIRPEVRATVRTPPALDAGMWLVLRAACEAPEEYIAREDPAYQRLRVAGVLAHDQTVTELGCAIVDALPRVPVDYVRDREGRLVARTAPDWPDLASTGGRGAPDVWVDDSGRVEVVVVGTLTEQGASRETLVPLTPGQRHQLERLAGLYGHHIWVDTVASRKARLAKTLSELLALDATLPHTDPDHAAPEWSERNEQVRYAVSQARVLGWPAGYAYDPAAPREPACPAHHAEDDLPHGRYRVVAYIEVPDPDGGAPTQCSWHLPCTGDELPHPHYQREWDGTTRERRDAAITAWCDTVLAADASR